VRKAEIWAYLFTCVVSLWKSCGREEPDTIASGVFVHDILARGPCTDPPHRSGRVVGSEALNEHNKHTDKHRERQ
jgi:hypothetical protein